MHVKSSKGLLTSGANSQTTPLQMIHGLTFPCESLVVLVVKYHYCHQENDILQTKNVAHIFYWCDKRNKGVLIWLICCCCYGLVTKCPACPGFPVLNYLPEFAQTHVYWVSDAIQPSYPLSLLLLLPSVFLSSNSPLIIYIYGSSYSWVDQVMPS